MPVKIAIGNSKGGVGKSTVTAALAYYFAHLKNKKVLVVDADSNQYTMDFVKSTGFVDFAYAQIAKPNDFIKLEMKHDLDSFDFILFDTSPKGGLSEVFNKVIEQTDHLIIPMKANPFDADAFLKGLNELIKSFKAINPNLKRHLLVNEIDGMIDNITKGILKAITEMDLNKLNTEFHKRAFFKSICLEPDRHDPKAIAEIESLLNELGIKL